MRSLIRVLGNVKLKVFSKFSVANSIIDFICFFHYSKPSQGEGRALRHRVMEEIPGSAKKSPTKIEMSMIQGQKLENLGEKSHAPYIIISKISFISIGLSLGTVYQKS